LFALYFLLVFLLFESIAEKLEIANSQVSLLFRYPSKLAVRRAGKNGVKAGIPHPEASPPVLPPEYLCGRGFALELTLMGGGKPRPAGMTSARKRLYK
jgi:hypothetical protein